MKQSTFISLLLLLGLLLNMSEGQGSGSLRNNRIDTLPQATSKDKAARTVLASVKSNIGQRAAENETSFELISLESSGNNVRNTSDATITGSSSSMPTRLEPARISCSALYSTACARTNAQWLATRIAQNITDRLLAGDSSAQVWKDVTSGVYNMETGFYPFIFDIKTSECIAEGGEDSYVGLTLHEIMAEQGNGFSDANSLIDRFAAAAEEGGTWVQYLWKDSGITHTKLAYIVKLYVSETRYHILGVGYGTDSLPPVLPCSAECDEWCSIINTLSLVGKAQLRLYESETLAQLETAMYELSFNKEEYQIPDGFYLFMYHYDGRLKAHGFLHDHFDGYIWDVYESQGLGTKEEARKLHTQFIEAAEGPGWLRYTWRNSPNDEPFEKVSYIARIQSGEDKYYVGCGFNFGKAVVQDDDENCSPDYNLPCSFRTALGLSSHVVSYAISSNDPVEEIWKAVSEEDHFRRGGFYPFVFDSDARSVSHAIPSFIGHTAAEIVASGGFNLTNPPTPEAFLAASRDGAGWCLYEWGIPGGNDDGSDLIFDKIAFVFKVNLYGNDYFGSVGFTHQRAPIRHEIGEGTKLNGEPIPCSRNYSLPCSEINAEAILGQCLAELTIAATEAIDLTDHEENLQDSELNLVLEAINSRDSAYRVNDFFVAVFSVDREYCTIDDGSGCCIAHGNNGNLRGKTWQQILDEYGISSIQGDALHRDLISASNEVGGYIDYPWSRELGEAFTKRALAAPYRHKGKTYYIITEYVKSPLPPTCDNCPVHLECTKGYQSFCRPIQSKEDSPLEWIVALSLLAGISLILFYWVRHRNLVKRRALDFKIKAMEDEIQGMVEICEDTGAQLPTAQKYYESFGMSDVEGIGTRRSKVLVYWYWGEDPSLLHKHEPSSILQGTTFVKYPDSVSLELEEAYQLLLKGGGYYEITLDLTEVASKSASDEPAGLKFHIDFEEMTQRNPLTNHSRAIRREEVPIQLAESLVEMLPPLPADIDFFGSDGEDFLPTFKGQVIQVSKDHPSLPWIYGTVLYDPLLDAAQDQPHAAQPGLFQILSNALHDRPSSGWFPKVLSVSADVKVMQNLLVTLGGEGMQKLKPPDSWDNSTEGIISVDEATAEYNEVVHYFLAALYEERDNVEVLGVERIQSTPLWQSYAVKKQTMKARDTKHPGNLINNRDLSCLERRWLFHGTRPEAIPQIVKQGFNRAFAGRNAVVYGMGVYFARDASYSSHHAYSRPDQNGVQRMFMCRVAVGDWCQGAEGMLTPGPKPNNSLEMFDSTVDDVASPSVFVVYHDSQAYPDYLVSFKRNDE